MFQEFIRESFGNTEILRKYCSGQCPEYREIQRLIYNGVRARDPKRPDHLIKNQQRLFEGKIGKSLSAYLTHLLSEASSYYLETNNNSRLIVNKEKFSGWQTVITEVPPLIPVVHCMLTNWGKPPLDNRSKLASYFDRFIKPQVRYSALPTIRDARLDELIARLGLDDLHLHLNGSTEIEVVWRDALHKPVAFTKELDWSRGNEMVCEQMLHDEVEFTQDTLLQRLNMARNLRDFLLRKSLGLVNGRESDSDLSRIVKIAQGVTEPTQLNDVVDDYFSHISPSLKTPLAKEAVVLMVLFNYLSEAEDESFAHGLYFYLLIKSQFMRMIVQQTHQFGFEQFQKITFNEIRSVTESRYENRYHQLSYNQQSDIQILEGRFAPNEDLNKNIERLTAILKGYYQYLSHKKLLNSDGSVAELIPKHFKELLDILPLKQDRTSLSLVAHFIKHPDREYQRINEVDSYALSWNCRHYDLRKQLEKTRRTLSALEEKHSKINDILHGYDAAANELDASPEVFSPIYRRLRNSGKHNFTFHAGEDFVHLLSGIRYVYEALEFLDLRTGNRLGHATAIGIDPKLWRDRIGPLIVMSRGERLDDLVLARYMLMLSGKCISVLPIIESEIRELSQIIYKEVYSPEDLYAAWKIRYIDPILALELDGDDNRYIRSEFVSEIKELTEIRKSRAFKIYKQYHSDIECLKVFAELIKVDDTKPSENALTFDIYRELQKFVIKEVNARQMAIESLPTSNVRISFYENYSEHHIYNWLGVGDEEGMEVPVVLGSDDPGIFSTNLRNEYAHVLIELDKRLPAMETIAKLEQIARNGKIWSFKNQNNR